MKIFSAEQIRDWDNFTIKNEPISSIDLMERASQTFVNWLVEKNPNQQKKVSIFCGQGNNGGDGVAIARLLQEYFFEINVHICKIGNSPSEDFLKNVDRLSEYPNIEIHQIHENDSFPQIDEEHILIDAIFGSGLNRPIEGYWGELIKNLNQKNQLMVAVDIPSGVFADQVTNSISIIADYTFSFQVPKLAFFFPENERRIGEWFCQSIDLHESFEKNTITNNFYLDHEMVKKNLKSRRKYAHKGTFGHALIIAGSFGKIGAAILCAKATLRTGGGLVTIHAPKCGYEILQSTVPEAMVLVDEHDNIFSKAPILDSYKTIGIGPGLGTDNITADAFYSFLEKVKVPIVIDADALNLIAKDKKYLEAIPANSILTPHPKEFERLFGATKNNFERNQIQRNFSQQYHIYIVLKGAHTCISTPEGNCYFNSTGNPGMATGGSGDVLTGILTALLSQGYTSLEASLLGVFLHGLAGDVALGGKISMESLIASDLIEHIGKAFITLQN